MRKKIVFMVSLLAIFGLVTSVFGQKKPDFPRKSVTVICPVDRRRRDRRSAARPVQGDGKVSRAVDHGGQ